VCVPPQVPPEAREDFEDDWEEAAFKTIKEDGNTVFRWVTSGEDGGAVLRWLHGTAGALKIPACDRSSTALDGIGRHGKGFRETGRSGLVIQAGVWGRPRL
jgi:hypothetical protein